MTTLDTRDVNSFEPQNDSDLSNKVRMVLETQSEELQEETVPSSEVNDTPPQTKDERVLTHQASPEEVEKIRFHIKQRITSALERNPDLQFESALKLRFVDECPPEELRDLLLVVEHKNNRIFDENLIQKMTDLLKIFMGKIFAPNVVIQMMGDKSGFVKVTNHIFGNILDRVGLVPKMVSTLLLEFAIAKYTVTTQYLDSEDDEEVSNLKKRKNDGEETGDEPSLKVNPILTSETTNGK